MGWWVGVDLLVCVCLCVFVCDYSFGQVTLLSSTKSKDCHWPLRVTVTDKSAEAIGIREQDSLCVRHMVKSRQVANTSPMFLGSAMDKAAIRGLDLSNCFFTVPLGTGFEALPQVATIYVYT